MIKYKIFSLAVILSLLQTNFLTGMDQLLIAPSGILNGPQGRPPLLSKKRILKVDVDAVLDSLNVSTDSSANVTANSTPFLGMRKGLKFNSRPFLSSNETVLLADNGNEYAFMYDEVGDSVPQTDEPELDLVTAWPIALEIFSAHLKARAFAAHVIDVASVSSACPICLGHCFELQQKSRHANIGINVAPLLCQLNIKIPVIFAPCCTSNGYKVDLFVGLANERALKNLFGTMVAEVVELFAWKTAIQTCDDDASMSLSNSSYHFYTLAIQDLAIKLFNDGRHFDSSTMDRDILIAWAHDFFNIYATAPRRNRMTDIFLRMQEKIRRLRYSWDIEMLGRYDDANKRQVYDPFGHQDELLLKNIDPSGKLLALCKDVAFRRVRASNVRNPISIQPRLGVSSDYLDRSGNLLDNYGSCFRLTNVPVAGFR